MQVPGDPVMFPWYTQVNPSQQSPWSMGAEIDCNPHASFSALQTFSETMSS